MSNKNLELWKKYIAWSLIPEDQRGLVATDADWARKNEVADRTLRRWKNNPEFIELQANFAEEVSPRERARDVEAGEGDEADYREVKAVLLEGARNGNPKYVEMYLKTYGKPFIDEEVASRSTDLSGMDLDDLVSRAVASLSPETLEQVLVGLGWQVTRPAS